MKLTTVIASVNNNQAYYLFIPKQIKFWGHFGIRFIAIFVGEEIPLELEEYRDNIILWSKNANLHSAFVAQNIRIYYPALLNLADDEMVMITDMDMLPMRSAYYKNGLENFKKEDFVYYRNIDGDQIYMCYNAAHPQTWSKVFGITSEKDIEDIIEKTYEQVYNGVPGSDGWFTDQKIMYSKLINYPNLHVLNRPIRRLETWMYASHLSNGHLNFTQHYDDAHFHRNYSNNLQYILDAEKQITALHTV